MILVTLGSQKFQFNRLLKKIDSLIVSGNITREVFAQTGYSDYKPINYKFSKFLDREEFAKMEAEADLVITHGGTGAIIGAVKNGKKVIACPRLAKYGEHVDDHQIQIIQEFDKMNIIEPCYEVDNLEEAVSNIDKNIYRRYESNTQNIINSIENFLNELK